MIYMASNYPSAHLLLSLALVPKLQPSQLWVVCTTAWVPYQGSVRVSLSIWLTLTRSKVQNLTCDDSEKSSVNLPCPLLLLSWRWTWCFFVCSYCPLSRLQLSLLTYLSSLRTDLFSVQNRYSININKWIWKVPDNNGLNNKIKLNNGLN